MIELLLTRPLPRSQEVAEAVERRFPGAFETVIWPLTRIEQETAPLDLDDVQGLLFTSANGVRAFARVSARRDLPALCVGAGTAAAARAEGLVAQSANGDSGALALLAASAWLPGAGPYLHVRGRDTVGDLAGALAAEGIETREVVLYAAEPAATVPPAVTALLEEGRIGAAALFSPRSARLFAGFAAEAREAGRGWKLGTATAIVISAATAEPLRALGFGRVEIAARPDVSGMIDALGVLAAEAGR